MRNARAWPHNVGRAVQTAPILLRYASVITEQTVGICWFKRLTRLTLSNNSKQHAKTNSRVYLWTRHVTSNNAWSCWPTMLLLFAQGFTHCPLDTVG